MKKLVLFLAVAATAICASRARADSTWNVTGTLTATGNGTETVHFAFDIGYVLDTPGGSTFLAQFSNLSASGTGVLGSSFQSFAGPLTVGNPEPPGGLDSNFIPLVDAGGDLFNVFLHAGMVSAPVAPQVGIDADLYACSTTACANAFGFPGGNLPELGLFFPATVSGLTVTPITTPEPASLILLLVGMALTRLRKI